jgi:hypothetical protein
MFYLLIYTWPVKAIYVQAFILLINMGLINYFLKYPFLNSFYTEIVKFKTSKEFRISFLTIGIYFRIFTLLAILLMINPYSFTEQSFN